MANELKIVISGDGKNLQLAIQGADASLAGLGKTAKQSGADMDAALGRSSDQIGRLNDELDAGATAMGRMSQAARNAGVAIGQGFDVVADKAKTVWEEVKTHYERVLLIWGVALATGIAAAVLGTVYAVFKGISFAIGLLTGESYKSANIDALIAANKEVKELQALLPLTAVGASALNEALKGQGLSAASYAQTLNAVRTAQEGNGEELDRLGVKYKDQKGQLLSTNQVLANTAAVLATYKEGWDRNAAAQAAGMGSEKQIQDALAITSEKIQTSKERLMDYNLVIGEDTQAAVARYEAAMKAFNREADLTSEGFKKAIADNIMPALTDLAEFFRDGFPAAVNAFRYSFATITSLFYGLKTSVYIVTESIIGSVSAIGSALGGVASASMKALKGDFAGARSDLLQGWNEAKDRLAGVGTNIVDMAKRNREAMKLAWAADSLAAKELAGNMEKVGKAFEKKPDAAKAGTAGQASDYDRLSQSIERTIALAEAELNTGQKLNDADKFRIQMLDDLKNAYANGRLDDAEWDKLYDRAIVAADTKALADNTAAYNTHIAALRQGNAEVQNEIETGQVLSAAQKKALAILTEITNGTRKYTEAQTLAVTAELERSIVLERVQAQRKAQIAADDKASEALAQEVTALRDGNTALKLHNEEIGLSQKALDALTLKRQDEAIAIQQSIVLESADAVARGEMTAAMKLQIDKLDELYIKRGRTAGGQVATANAPFTPDEPGLKDLAAYLDPNKAKSFGDALKEAFAGASSELVKLTGTFADYATKSTELAKMQKVLADDTSLTPQNRIKAEIALTERQAQIQVGAYADMAGAAKGFFGQHTAGYKLLHAAEQALRVFQLASAIEVFLRKTTLKTAEVGITAAASGAELGIEATKTAASSVLAGTEASAWGITAVVKSLASLPFPFNLAAGAATLAAVVAIGAQMTGGIGGGGSDATEQRQKANGTGTVFGDSDAKSASLSKALELMAKNSTIALNYSSGMLTSLRSIETLMAGLGNLVARTSGVTTGGNLGIATFAGKVEMPAWLGGAAGNLLGLWGKTKQEITDAGLSISGTTASLASGQGARQYADVSKTSSSWFGLVKNTSNSTEFGKTDAALSRQIGLVFVGVTESLKSAATLLGQDTRAVGESLAKYLVDIPRLSLEGLKGNELQAAIAAALSAQADKMAAIALPGFDAFAKIGEGYFETVARVGKALDEVNGTLTLLGAQLFALSAAGAKGALGLVDALGGMEAFAEKTRTFYEQYFTEGERNANTVKAVTAELAKVNLALPATRDEFKKLVQTYIALGESGVPTVAALLGVAGAFDTVSTFATNAAKDAVDAARKAADEAQKIAREQLTWQDKLDVLTGKTTQREIALRDSLEKASDDTIRALISQVSAQEDLKAAAEATAAAQAKAAAEAKRTADSITATWKTITDTILDEVKRLRGEVVGTGATGYAQAQAEFAITTAKARAGDQDAAKLLPGLSRNLDTLAQANAGTLLELRRMQAQTASSLAGTAGVLGGVSAGQAAAAGSAGRPVATVVGAGAATASQAAPQGSSKYTEKYQLPTGISYVQVTDAQAVARYDSINAAITEIGVATPEAVQRLAATAQQYGVSMFELATASGYLYSDVKNVFAKAGVPAFASGGLHAGGARIVGENGPELEVTGPSRIFNAPQIASALRSAGGGGGGADTGRLESLVEQLTQEVAALRADAAITAAASKSTFETLRRVTRDGNAMVTTT